MQKYTWGASTYSSVIPRFTVSIWTARVIKTWISIASKNTKSKENIKNEVDVMCVLGLAINRTII